MLMLKEPKIGFVEKVMLMVKVSTCHTCPNLDLVAKLKEMLMWTLKTLKGDTDVNGKAKASKPKDDIDINIKAPKMPKFGFVGKGDIDAKQKHHLLKEMLILIQRQKPPKVMLILTLISAHPKCLNFHQEMFMLMPKQKTPKMMLMLMERSKSHIISLLVSVEPMIMPLFKRHPLLREITIAKRKNMLISLKRNCLFSQQNRRGLKMIVSNYKTYFENTINDDKDDNKDNEDKDINLDNIAYTLVIRQSPFKHRIDYSKSV
jgi:hypothetical protein